MPDLKDPAIIKWKWRTEDTQQYFCDSLSDRRWERYADDEYIYLAKKIAFSMYGLPQDENMSEPGLEGYDEKQRVVANKLKEVIVRLKPADDDLCIAFLFVCCKDGDKEFPEPVFRVLQRVDENKDDVAVYVDTCGRIYADWNRYLTNNMLPECVFCYPEHGWYEYDERGLVRIQFALSPACSTANQLRKYGDTASTVLSFAAAGVGVASMFTPIAPVVGLAALVTGTGAGVYGAARGAEVVVDRKQHGQSISLKDSEARGVWLNIAATAIGTAAGFANAQLVASAKAGEVVSKAGRAAINALNVSNLSVNGIVIVDRFVYMMKRFKDNKLTTLDVLQFTTSVFFFTNSLISIKTARGMIKEAQSEVLQGHSETLPTADQLAFKKDLRLTRNEARSTMYGNSRVIKSINRVESAEGFRQNLAASPMAGEEEDRLMPSAAVSPVGNLLRTPGGAPIAVSPTSEGEGGLIGKGFQIFTSAGAVLKTLDELFSQQNIGIFRVNIDHFLENIKRAFKSRPWTEFEINGVRIFGQMHPFEQERMGDTMRRFSVDPDVTDAAIRVAERQRVRSATEFGDQLDSVNAYVSEHAPSAVARPLLLKELQNPRSASFAEVLEGVTHRPAVYHFCRQSGSAVEDLQFGEHLQICRDLFGEDAVSISPPNVIFSPVDDLRVAATYVDAADCVFTVLIERIPQEDNVFHFTATVDLLRD